MKVIVANRLEWGGKSFKGGDSVELPSDVARDLLSRGKVRKAPVNRKAPVVRKPVGGKKNNG